MSRRRCVFRCVKKDSLFALPKDETAKNEWLHFIYNTVPEKYNPNVQVCAAHFADDCFTNLGEIKTGYARKLWLKSGGIPTIKTSQGQSDASDSQPITDRSFLVTLGISPASKKRTRTPEGTRADRESDKCHAKTRIDIGRAFPLWRKVGEQMGFKSDPEMAFFLLQRVCSENISVQRKRGRPQKSTPGTALQTGESEGDSTHPSDEDEDMEASEICYEVSPSRPTEESSQNRLKSDDRLKTDHQLMSEDQIKTDHQLMSEDQIKTDHQLMSEDQIKTDHQLMSEDQIKTEDHLDEDICKVSVAPTQNADIVPQSSTLSTTTKEIKEEPVETELDNRLEVSTGPVDTSEKIDPCFGQGPNQMTVEAAGQSKRPLAPQKKHLTGLFPTCLQCGGPVLEYTTVSSGRQNHLQWKCSEGHLMWLFPNSNP